MLKTKFADTLLVSIDVKDNNHAVLVVGRQTKGPNMPTGKIDIVNAFQGQDALDIYTMLVHRKTD